jgi:hypothetical protein
VKGRSIITGFLAGLAVLAGVSAVAAEEEAQQGQSGNDRYSELVKEKGEFRETWVLPGVDPSKYDKVFVWEGQFEYRDVGPARKTRSMRYSHKSEFGIAEDARRRFEEIVREAFGKEIVKAESFRLITDVADVDTSTLILRGGLFDIVSRVPPATVGRADIYLANIGEATLALELIDAESGTVIALVAERRAIETLNRMGGPGMPTNTATIIGDIRRWAGNLARRLRVALDKAIQDAKQ